MAKTKEELSAIRDEVAKLAEKLSELTDEELAEVVAGNVKITSTKCWFGTAISDGKRGLVIPSWNLESAESIFRNSDKAKEGTA